jgi:hypothetical protein
MDQASAFVSYRFRMAEEYAKLLDMFERQGLAVVNRSVDPWNPPPLATSELMASLDMRIRVATHVIVLVSDDLAQSPCCNAEIQIARRYKKPIIAVYPNGTFGAPIPKVLNGGLYRAVGWRGNALERAIRGEYPPEARVFDISEQVALRQGVALVGTIAAGTAVSFGLRLEREVEHLRQELSAAGITIPADHQPSTAPWLVGGALGGALLASVLGGPGRDLLVGAAIGTGLGFGVGSTVRAQATIKRLGPLVEVYRLGRGSPSLV